MKELLKTVQVAVRLSLQNWRLHLKLKSFASSRTHHLMDKGYSVQRGRLSASECQMLRTSIDELIADNNFSWCDNLKSDYRIYEAEKKINLTWLEDRLFEANEFAVPVVAIANINKAVITLFLWSVLF